MASTSTYWGVISSQTHPRFYVVVRRGVHACQNKPKGGHWVAFCYFLPNLQRGLSLIWNSNSFNLDRKPASPSNPLVSTPFCCWHYRCLWAHAWAVMRGARIWALVFILAHLKCWAQSPASLPLLKHLSNTSWGWSWTSKSLSPSNPKRWDYRNKHV